MSEFALYFTVNFNKVDGRKSAKTTPPPLKRAKCSSSTIIESPAKNCIEGNV